MIRKLSKFAGPVVIGLMMGWLWFGGSGVVEKAEGTVTNLTSKTLTVPTGARSFQVASGGYYLVSKDTAGDGYSVAPSSTLGDLCTGSKLQQGQDCYKSLGSGQVVAGAAIQLQGQIGYSLIQEDDTDNTVILSATGGLVRLDGETLWVKSKKITATTAVTFWFWPSRDLVGEAKIQLTKENGAALAVPITLTAVDIFPPLISVDGLITGGIYAVYVTAESSLAITGKVDDASFKAPDGAAYPSAGIKSLKYMIDTAGSYLAVDKLAKDGTFRINLTGLSGVVPISLQAEDKAGGTSSGSNGNFGGLAFQLLKEGDVNTLVVTTSPTAGTSTTSLASLTFTPSFSFYKPEAKQQTVQIAITLPGAPAPPAQRVEIVIKRGGTNEIMETFRDARDVTALISANTLNAGYNATFLWDISDHKRYRPGTYEVAVNVRTLAGKAATGGTTTSPITYIIGAAVVSEVKVGEDFLSNREEAITPLQLESSVISPVIMGRVTAQHTTAITNVNLKLYEADVVGGNAVWGVDAVVTNDVFTTLPISAGLLSFNTIYRLVLAPEMKPGEFLPLFNTRIYFYRPNAEADDNPVLHEVQPNGTPEPRFLTEEALARVVADGADYYKARLILVDAFGNTVPNITVEARTGAALGQQAYDLDRDQVRVGFDQTALNFNDITRTADDYFGALQSQMDPLGAGLDPRSLRYELQLGAFAPTVDDRNYRSLVKDGSFTAANHAVYWTYPPPAVGTTTPLVVFAGEHASVKSLIPGSSTVAGNDAAFLKPDGYLRQELVDVAGYADQVLQIHVWGRRVGGAAQDEAKLNLGIEVWNATQGLFVLGPITARPIVIPDSGQYEEFFLPFTVGNDWQRAQVVVVNVTDRASSSSLAIGKVRVEEAAKNSKKGYPGEKVIDLPLTLRFPSGNEHRFLAVDTLLPLGALTPSEPNIKGTCDPFNVVTSGTCSGAKHGYLTTLNSLDHGVSAHFEPALTTAANHLFTLDISQAGAIDASAVPVVRGGEREKFLVTFTNQSSLALEQMKLTKLWEFDTKFEAGFGDILLEQSVQNSQTPVASSDAQPTTNLKQYPLTGTATVPAANVNKLFLSAVPFASAKLNRLRGLLDTTVNYKIRDASNALVEVTYPGQALALEALFGAGQVRTDLETNLVRESLLMSVLKTKEKTTELIGGFTVEKLRELVDRNVNSLLREATPDSYPGGGNVLILSSQAELGRLFDRANPLAGTWLSPDGQVAFVRNRNVVIGNMDAPEFFFYPSGVKTLIVEGGNVILASGLRQEKASDSFGLIVRHCREGCQQPGVSNVSPHRFDKIPGGNVFLHSQVKRVEGSFYLEGLLLSYDHNTEVPRNLNSTVSLWDAMRVADPFSADQGDTELNLTASGPNVGKYPSTVPAGIYPTAEANRLTQLKNQFYFRGTLVTGQGQGITYRNSWNGSRGVAPQDEEFALSKVLDLAKLREFEFDPNNNDYVAPNVPEKAKRAAVIIEKDQRLFREVTIPPGFKLTGLSWQEL